MQPMNLPFCLPSDHRVVGTRNWGRVQGVTLAPGGRTEGEREFLCFRQGFYVAMSKLVHMGARRDVYPSGDFLKLHFRLAGESRVAQAAAPGSQCVAPMSVSTLVQPHDSFKEEYFSAGAQERSLTLCCSRAFLADELGLGPATPAQGAFGHYLKGASGRFELQQSPLRTPQLDVANALLDSRPADPYRALFAEAKAFELLHGFLSRVTAGDGTPAVDADATHGTAGAARERLAPVTHYIDSHLAAPMDMRGLTQRFGMSEGQLSRAFQDAFGLPVFNYIGKQRLQRGRELLERGQMSVTEVAFSVGYNHVANFSTACKRAYGKSPQALRKTARSPVAA